MRISTKDRLEALPFVFSLDMARQEMIDLDDQGVRVALSRMTKQQHLEPIGPKAGVYFNLYRDKSSPVTHLAAGFRLCHNPICVRGKSALFEHGIIPVRPPCWTLAIKHNSNYIQMYDAELSLRPAKYFELLTKKGHITEHKCGLPMLSIEATLADMRHYGDPALPAAEDIALRVSWSRVDEIQDLLTMISQRGRKDPEFISAGMAP